MILARIAGGGRGRRLAVRSEDGFDLNARVHEAADSRGCVVACHGITSDSRESGAFTRLARAAVDRGISVVRFDFRGHGRSAGSDRDFTLAGQRADLEAVLAAVGELGLERRLLLGMSFGASVVVAETARGGYPGLVLWSAVVDYARTALAPTTPWGRELLASRDDPSLPEWAAMKAPGSDFRISSELARECESDSTPATLRSLELPVLAFSTDADEIVPFEPIAEAAATNPRIDLRTLPGDVHGLHVNLDRVVAESVEWIEQLLAAPETGR